MPPSRRIQRRYYKLARQLVVCAGLCFAPILSAALPASLPDGATGYSVDFWRDPEGLPQSRIRAITQTSDGYIWLGTDNGLVRFNGMTFTAFTVATGSLKDNEVWALQEDDDHALWIGTYGGGLTRLKDGKFTTYTTAAGLPDDVVTHIAKDSAGDLWITTPGGLSRYSHGVFSSYMPSDGSNFGTLSVAGPGHVFVASIARTLQFSEGRFTSVPGAVEEGGGAIEQLLSSRDGSLWVGFSNSVIKQLKDGRWRTYTPERSTSPQVTLLYEDPDGGIWAAYGQRLSKLRGDRFETVLVEDDKTDLGIVYSMAVDREGGIWVGLQSGGLARLRVKQISTIASREGLPNDSTRSVFQDSRGAIWIGTASGFGRYADGQMTVWTEAAGHRLGAVRSFAEDGQGRLWVAASKDLLIMQFGQLSPMRGWNGRTEIEAILRDSRGDMWVGTDGDGLFHYEGGKFISLRDSDGLAGNRIRAIFEDNEHAFWISTFGGGVSRFDRKVFTSWSTPQGLAGNRVTGIHQDEEGALWFATRGGLTRRKDGRFFSFTSASGLPTDFLYGLLDDGKGHFWFSSAQGLIRASKSEMRAFAEGRIRKISTVVYGVRDGMKTSAMNVGNQPSAWKTSDGLLLFSSLKGLVVVDPGKVLASDFVPPVLIESVTVNRVRQELNSAIHVPQGAGEVEIQYAALSYLDPGKTRFRYRLEGVGEDWVDAGSRPFAYFSNLPPGNFRFQVIAGNVDGFWNERGAWVSFYLEPHFYQTRLFWGIVVAALCLLAWLSYRLHMMEVRARYSAVLAERNRISQDIHDTFAQNLAGIALQLDSVTMQLEGIPPALREQIDEACNLTRYSLAEARRTVADLRSDELERAELPVALPEITDRLIAHRPGGRGSLETRIQVTGTPQKLSAVAEKNLLRIFQEALANALRHSHAETIDIELKYEREELALRVRDNGCGFDADSSVSMTVGHYGLTGMRERAERIGGCLTLNSSPGNGTELLVVVPFRPEAA